MIFSIIASLTTALAVIVPLLYFLKGKEFVARYLVIGPFLSVVGALDFLIGLVVPYKYNDVDLPDKNAVLTEITDKNNLSSAYRSTLTPDLVKLENKNTNLYDEFAAAAKKYW